MNKIPYILGSNTAIFIISHIFLHNDLVMAFFVNMFQSAVNLVLAIIFLISYAVSGFSKSALGIMAAGFFLSAGLVFAAGFSVCLGLFGIN